MSIDVLPASGGGGGGVSQASQNAQNVLIAALQTAVSPDNATQSELDAAIALLNTSLGDKVDQSVYDAMLAANATDAELAVVVAALNDVESELDGIIANTGEAVPVGGRVIPLDDPRVYINNTTGPIPLTGNTVAAITGDGLELDVASGDVQTVTGTAVDNTSPQNPVINHLTGNEIIALIGVASGEPNWLSGFTADTTSPTSTASVSGGSNSIVVTVNEDSTMYWSVTPAAETDRANVDSGLASIDFDTLSATSGAPTSANIDFTGAATGTYFFNHYSIDAAGNVETPVQSVSFPFVAATSSNVAGDGGFDDPAKWNDVPVLGVVAGSKLTFNNGTTNFVSVSTSSGQFDEVTAETTYNYSIDVTNMSPTDEANNRIWLRVEFATSEFNSGIIAGSIVQLSGGRIQVSTATLGGTTGTLGPFQFTTPAGASHIKLYIESTDQNRFYELDNLVIEVA